ncbi:MAG: TIGR00730 family Rossman fold protein [Clostridiales bacterium]|nr:TIGR00730 family Rossman fold protein [Clostridiales bacterium]
MNICVYGASSNQISPVYTDAVEQLGEKLAKRGHSLVFGAGNSGCMGASARGAQKGGGEIIGIAPTFFEVDGVLFEHCTKFIGTETMRERKKLLEEYSDAFIVTPGGIGTYDEFFEIITLKQLERHSKAIAIYNVNGYYDELESLLDKAVREDFMTGETKALVRFFTDADEMLDYIEDYIPPKIIVSNMKHI